MGRRAEIYFRLRPHEYQAALIAKEMGHHQEHGSYLEGLRLREPWAVSRICQAWRWYTGLLRLPGFSDVRLDERQLAALFGAT